MRQQLAPLHDTRFRPQTLSMGSNAEQRLLEVPAHYAAAKAGLTGFTLAL